ncbi:TetR/AcrR family transcriptional regulator [Promicromonospora sp. NPDC057488]|uniref:TetR/AcrR family transcriptional regulator n=1 Tax=Promicromonospora sp. NPDC057488 TaxID=3346147 RepID=UPI00366CFAF3
MSEDRPPGLRERKRAAARARVEEVAIDLCLRHGYEAVTVGQICAAADIAQSTFFNYFGSKDAAILGRPPCPSPQAVQAFVQADGPLLGDLLALMVAGARDAVGDLELFRRRFELIDGNPALRARELDRSDARGSWQREAVERRLRRDPRLTPDDVAERAHLTAALATSILRHALWSVRHSPAAHWGDHLRRSLGLAQDLLVGPARDRTRAVPRGGAPGRTARPGGVARRRDT